jgi:hypothetical protein
VPLAKHAGRDHTRPRAAASYAGTVTGVEPLGSPPARVLAPLGEEEEMVDEDWLIAKLASLYHERPDEVTDEEIRRRIEENDVVCGVWRAPDKPGGIGYLPLMGDAFLAEYMGSRQPGTVKLAVVPCKSSDDALRTKRMFGTPEGG